MRPWQTGADKLEKLPQITVAVINGHVWAGSALAGLQLSFAGFAGCVKIGTKSDLAFFPALAAASVFPSSLVLAMLCQ